MQRKESKFNRLQKIGIAMVFFSSILFISTPKEVEAANLGGPSHIGTFEGSTTFTTSSSNGVNPGLYLEVMDRYGNYKEYTSEDGVITVDGTKEGSYVTQAKLLGKTKYRDIQTGELLDQWEEGRDLELESVKMPVLKTTGKNLFDGELVKNKYYNGSTGELVAGNNNLASVNPIRVNPNTSIVLSTSANLVNNNHYICEYASDGTFIKRTNSSKITTSETTYFIKFHFAYETINESPNVQVEEGPVATSYEPFKSNILTVNEPIELRGIGNVQDELDLITGEVVQNIGEMVLDGSEDWFNPTTRDNLITFRLKKSFLTNADQHNIPNDIICDKLPLTTPVKVWANNGYIPNSPMEISRGTNKDDGIDIIVDMDRMTEITNLVSFKQWLNNNHLTVQYQLAEKPIKTVVLNSDYYFQPVMNRDVHVDGTILPLICSVTIPTESLSFVLNPNEEKGKQFIAPEFTITNNTPTSIYLALNTFEQLTEVLNDVLPTEHENWNTLDRKQSKDIALALVPKPSDGWLSLTEGPRYVADSSNYYLGEVKAESSVDFTFEANHGRAFLETLSPRYRLSFIFDFFDK